MLQMMMFQQQQQQQLEQQNMMMNIMLLKMIGGKSFDSLEPLLKAAEFSDRNADNQSENCSSQ